MGGAAHLWDCVPSKAMIATGDRSTRSTTPPAWAWRWAAPSVDLEALRERIGHITEVLEGQNRRLLESQGVNIVRGTGRLVDAHHVVAETEDGEEFFEADAVMVSTGSRPRIPDWAQPDGDRVLTTRDAYPPKVLPEHLVVVGSGVTGVEFVHMFSSFGS